MHFTTVTLLLLASSLTAAAPTPQLDTSLGELTNAIPRPGEDPANSIPDLTAALGSAVNAIPGGSNNNNNNNKNKRQLGLALGELVNAIPRPGEDPANSIPDLTAALGSTVNAIPGGRAGVGGGFGRRVRARQLDAAIGQLVDAIPRPGEDPQGSIPDLTAALGSTVDAIPGGGRNGGA